MFFPLSLDNYKMSKILTPHGAWRSPEITTGLDSFPEKLAVLEDLFIYYLLKLTFKLPFSE